MKQTLCPLNFTGLLMNKSMYYIHIKDVNGNAQTIKIVKTK